MIDRALLPGSLPIFAPAGISNPQVTFELHKITCTQLAHFHIANLDDIGLWLSGYYDGKSDNLLLDTERMKARRRIEANLLENSQSAGDEGLRRKEVEEERLPS